MQLDPVWRNALLVVNAVKKRDEMVAWPVSQRIGNVKNNDASLIEPITLEV